MTVLVIILICAPLLIFFLAAPIILIVDTETDEYCIRLGDMCSLRALTTLENPGIRLRIGFWKKTWGMKEQYQPGSNRNGSSVMGSNRNGSNASRVAKTREETKQGTSRSSIRRMWRVLKTFRVSKCDVLLDTDDFILNAQLFPVFQFCNGRWGHWRVNFEGDCRLQLEVESRLIRVLYAWWWKT